MDSLTIPILLIMIGSLFMAIKEYKHDKIRATLLVIPIPIVTYAALNGMYNLVIGVAIFHITLAGIVLMHQLGRNGEEEKE